MAITFVAGNHGSTAYTTSYTVAKPTNTDGDLVVAIVGGNGASLSGSGWTLLMQTTARSGGSYDQTSVYYKIASSEGTGNYTVTLSASQIATGWIGAYRGVNASTPLDTTNKTITNATSTTNLSPSSITAASGQWGIVFGVGYEFGTATARTHTETGSPTVTTEQADFGVTSASPDNTSMVVAEYDNLSAGAFAPTVTRQTHAADVADKGSFLINPGATNANADIASATGSALDAFSPNLSQLTATGAALDAAAGLGVNAGVASATGAGIDVSFTPVVGAASTGQANDAAVGMGANAGVAATASAVALDATVAFGVQAGVASATGAALDAPLNYVQGGLAAPTARALDATVSIGAAAVTATASASATASLTYTAAPRVRTYRVEFEKRSQAIARESRTFAVPYEIRKRVIGSG